MRGVALTLWLQKGPKPPARYGTESKNSIFLKQENYVSTLVLNQTLVVSLTLKSQWCKNKLSFLQKIISWSAKIENKYRFASFFDQENQRCLALDFLMKFSFPKFRPTVLCKKNANEIRYFSRLFGTFRQKLKKLPVKQIFVQSSTNLWKAYCFNQNVNLDCSFQDGTNIHTKYRWE